MSVLLRPPFPREAWGWLPLLAGLAVVTPLARLSGLELGLKWPNDVLVGERKLAGLLAEVVDDAVVVGLGLNVSLRADELPVPTATSLAIEASEVTDREPVLRAVLRDLARRYRPSSRPAATPSAPGLHDAYRQACTTVGRRCGSRCPATACSRASRSTSTPPAGWSSRRPTADTPWRPATSFTCGSHGEAGTIGLVPGIPKRLLADDEDVVMAMRPHWKEMVGPVLVLLITSPAASYLAKVVPESSAQGWLRLAIVVIAALVVLRFMVWPFVKWLTTSYVVTDRRIITRVGVVARTGRDMPISRINDVTFQHSGILERMLGCGTLVVESAGERGQLVLRDVPHVEEVQRDVYRLAEADEERRRGGREDREDGRDGSTSTDIR